MKRISATQGRRVAVRVEDDGEAPRLDEGRHPRVKTHKWLAQIDWKKAEARKLEAPWKPKIKSATDASNFDEFDDDAKENFPREDFAKDLFKEFADVWV